MTEMTKAEWNKAIDKLLEKDMELAGTVGVKRQTYESLASGVDPDNMVTARMIGQYTRGTMGDPDPLYTDHEYGRYTRYGSMIAPPTFSSRIAPPTYYINKPSLPGWRAYYGGTTYDYSSNKPIRPGDKIHSIQKYLGYAEKTKASGKPYRLFTNSSQSIAYNQRDEIVAVTSGHEIVTATYPGDTAEMTQTLFTGREKKPRYTQEELEAIRSFYDDELAGKHRRGAEVRYWEDVEEGEEIPKLIEGPLSLIDVMAIGAYVQGAFAIHWAYYRQNRANWAIDPDTGDYMPSWHYDDRAAQHSGLLRAHSLGEQTEGSLAHVLCNWIGDDGWVKRLDIQHRAVRFFGDDAHVKGKVTKKYIDEDGEHVVDLEIWSEIPKVNGLVNSTGTATVRLVSRRD